MNTQTIDYRKDPAPRDWLNEHAAKFDKYPIGELKTEHDLFKEFVDVINNLRCEPSCPSESVIENGSEVGNDSDSAGKGHANKGHSVATCICSLAGKLTSTENGVVPRDEFVTAAKSAGYGPEQALEQYRNYATVMLDDKYQQAFDRLLRESENAYNWGMELDMHEPFKQMEAAEREIQALDRKIDQELEALMSA